MRYVLDFDTLAYENFLRTGSIPNIHTIKMLDLMVELASIAYQQGQSGKSFNIGHGIPIKLKE